MLQTFDSRQRGVAVGGVIMKATSVASRLLTMQVGWSWGKRDVDGFGFRYTGCSEKSRFA